MEELEYLNVKFRYFVRNTVKLWQKPRKLLQPYGVSPYFKYDNSVMLLIIPGILIHQGVGIHLGLWDGHDQFIGIPIEAVHLTFSPDHIVDAESFEGQFKYALIEHHFLGYRAFKRFSGSPRPQLIEVV